ncbi:MAG TPA: NAD(P)H-dependent oxidoreductase subunit E, partial [Candidatus Cybelea sp.]
MDLHFTSEVATAAERTTVDAALRPLQNGLSGSAARAQRHLLLPVLHAVVDRIGWVSAGALNYISERLEVAPAEVYGVATFYALLSTVPRPPRAVHVCDDIACLGAGSEALCSLLESAFGPAGSPMHDTAAGWHRSPCLGLCDRAPAALVTTAGDPPSALALAPVGGET